MTYLFAPSKPHQSNGAAWTFSYRRDSSLGEKNMYLSLKRGLTAESSFETKFPRSRRVKRVKIGEMTSCRDHREFVVTVFQIMLTQAYF